MEYFNVAVERLHFRKIVAGYIILAVAMSLLSVGFLSYVFRDKLLFAYNFNNLSEKIRKGDMGVNALKASALSLSKQSSDIVDILLLNKDNNVLFSAKGSSFGHGTFKLEVQSGERNRYLTYLENPDISFRLMDTDDLMFNAIFVDHENKISRHYMDENFYRNNFTTRKIYLLNYAVDRTNGDKMYFISDVHPVANGELYIAVAGSLGMIFVALYWILLALWVYQNARKSRTDAVLWGSITLATNLVGLFVYLIYRQSNKSCYKCNTIQSKDNIFCRYCGTRIGHTCTTCDRIIHEEDRFCSSCGNAQVSVLE